MIAIDEARSHYVDHGDPVHDFDHVLRVTAMAERIARAEGADVEVVRAAALLHDIARDDDTRDHAEAAAERARSILQSQPAYKIDAVVQAIAQHRFRGGAQPASLEARCLFDADKLDAIGAIGVARVFAFSGVLGRVLWGEVAPDYEERFSRGETDHAQHSAHHEFVVKLRHLRERMTTATGRALAEERHATMTAFFERLAQEVKGIV